MRVVRLEQPGVHCYLASYVYFLSLAFFLVLLLVCGSNAVSMVVCVPIMRMNYAIYDTAQQYAPGAPQRVKVMDTQRLATIRNLGTDPAFENAVLYYHHVHFLYWSWRRRGFAV